MIKVVYENKKYAYLPKKSIWVSSTNQVISSPDKAEILRQIATDNGYTDIDFKKPSSDLERYIQMLEDDKSSNSTDIVENEKEHQKKNSKLKSSIAVSLTNLIKNKEK